MKTLLIVPAYNEAKSIVSTCSAIQKSRPELDFVVIDDGSTDTTAELCEAHGFQCIKLTHNLGVGGSVQTGYRYALEKEYECAVQFDGDGQHDIASLDAIVKPIEQGECDLCIGSRMLKESTSVFKSTPARRLGIRLISDLLYLFGGQKITDPTSGYRAANRETIKYFASHYPAQYPEPESIIMLLRQGLRISEYPVNMFARTQSKSSIHSWKTIYYMLTVSLAITFTAFMSTSRGDRDGSTS